MINMTALLLMVSLSSTFLVIATEACAEEGLRLKKVGTEKAYFARNGKPLLSFGGLSDFLFYGELDAYDYVKWADWAMTHGINHVRAYPPLSWKHIQKFTEENGGSLDSVLFPYKETSPGSRQFDLTEFDEAYWKRLRQKCEYLKSKDIIIHLLMWNGWQLRDNEVDWQGHFFNPDNNVNSFTDHLGGDLENRLKIYHSVADNKAGLVNAQKAWFHKLVEATADLDNVYYDLVHEIKEHHRNWEKVQPWIDEMSLTVRDSHARLNPDTPPIIGMDTGGLSREQRDWIFTRPYFDLLIYGKKHTVENAKKWRIRYKKPYIPQESWDDNGDKYSYRCPNHRVHIRKYMWKFMMAKCQQLDLYMKPRSRGQSRHASPENPPGFPHNYDPDGWSKFEDDALVLREFWNSLVDYPNLWFEGGIESGPGGHQYILSSGKEVVAYCSSATGKEGVKFKSEPLKLKELSLSDGTYTAEILKPDSGVIAERTATVKGGAVSIDLPSFTDDIAVHMHSAKLSSDNGKT